MLAAVLPTTFGELLSLLIVALLTGAVIVACLVDFIRWRREWRAHRERERAARKLMRDAAWQASRRFINRNPWDQS